MRIALLIFLWLLVAGCIIAIIYQIVQIFSIKRSLKPKKDAFYAVADNLNISMFELVRWYHDNETESTEVTSTIIAANPYNFYDFDYTDGVTRIRSYRRY